MKAQFQFLAYLLLGLYSTPNLITMTTNAQSYVFADSMQPTEKQITHAAHGHILTHYGVWSPDGEWIVYDTRSDAAGEKFDGNTIEKVNVNTGEVKTLYSSKNGAHCGVVSYSPVNNELAFILGPENPDKDWQYCAYHRQGAWIKEGPPIITRILDARDLVPPYTPGALRGGSHVHMFSGDGSWLSYTYEDHVLSQLKLPSKEWDINQRNVGISAPVKEIKVNKLHPRNHDGAFFSVLVTRTTSIPRPGSDDIQKACEEGWIGKNGYIKSNGERQNRALAFQGQVLTSDSSVVSEVFIVDIPDDITIPGEGPLQGTETRLPRPPKGTVQKRLTYTTHRRYPGIQGPRHWLHSSPDGTRIAFYMKDDNGVVQLWTISPNGGQPEQITSHPWSITSGYSWSSDGRRLVYIADNSVWATELSSRKSVRLTPRTPNETSPRPEACVLSPDNRKVAYVRHVKTLNVSFNQIFVCSVPD